MGFVTAERPGTSDWVTGWIQERYQSNLVSVITNGSNTYTQKYYANSSTQPMVYSFRVSAAANSTSANVNLTAQTGTSVGENIAPSGFLSSGSGNHLLNIGNRGTVGNYPLDGFLAEVLLFDRSLSDAEQERVINYLNDKWSLFYQFGG